MLVVSVNPRSGRIAWCSAGNPAPLLAVDGGPARLLSGRSGPALGQGDDAPRPENVSLLEPGERLLIHTGELAADVSEDVTLPALLPTAPPALLPAAPPADDRPDGDVAVVTVHRRAAAVAARGLPQLDLTWTYPLDVTTAATVRRDLSSALDSDAVDPDLLFDLRVAATEAINNAVEHAQQPREPQVRVTLRVTGGLVRLGVQDFGDWRARPASRDRGRGAILMNAYGEVRVTTNDLGTLITIERQWTAASDG
jgi:anti-sigma regulatory factor (Ser/Thr protein kinase)